MAQRIASWSQTAQPARCRFRWKRADAARLTLALLTTAAFARIPLPASAQAVGTAGMEPTPQPAAHPRLVRSQQDIFLITGRKRRWIVSPQVFTDYRFRDDWVETISDDEMGSIPRGPDLIAGPVLRAPDGELWVVYQGTRRQIAGPDAWTPLYLSPEDAQPVTTAQLESYPIGRPVGNPPRPWLLWIVAAVAAAGAGLIWYGGPRVHQPNGGAAINAAADESRALVAGARLPPRPKPRWNPLWPAKHALPISLWLRSGWQGSWGWLRSWWPIGALMLAAAALKLVFVMLYPWVPDGADAPAYVTAARYLASGGSLLSDGPYGGLIGVTSPLYPMILALLSGAVALARGSVVGWKLAQAGASLLLVPLAGALAARLYGRRAAWVAAIIAALSPLWFYSAELLQYELWLALLIAGGLLALVHACARGRPSRAWLALAGACHGLAAFLQLKVVVLLLPAIIYLCWRCRPSAGKYRNHRYTMGLTMWPLTMWPRAASLVLFFSVPALLPLIAWGARNVVVHGEPLLGSTGAGVLLWMGNHPGATGGYMQLPRPDAFYDYLRRYPEHSITREARAFGDLALDFIRHNPSQFALLALIKLERFWWTITPDRLGEFLELRTEAFLGGWLDATAITLFSKLLHTGMLAISLAGLLWGPRLQHRMPTDQWLTAERWLLLATIALFWLVHVPFIAEPRYRLPIAPLLQVLEGAGIAVLLDSLRRAWPRRRALLLASDERGG